jgi:adenylate kinase family enzyme
MPTIGILIFFCGKMGAGKSTKSKEISITNNAVLLSEDEWLSVLYPEQISSFDDYIKFSALLRPLIKAHVQKILLTGTDVILDFPDNTLKQRAWLKKITSEINANHQLIYLNIDDKTCINQIAKRRLEQPERAVFDTEKMFHHVTKYFEPPAEGEQLNITMHIS